VGHPIVVFDFLTLLPLLNNTLLQYQIYETTFVLALYEGYLESKKHFAIKKYLLIGKKKNMQVLSYTFTYFSTQSPWTLRHLSYREISLLIPSSYQKAAWLNVHEFCGIANVW